jgi:curved DNA-binding protein CbpA
MENYYELLNVDVGSTSREIKRAYRKKVVRFNNREMNNQEKEYVKRLKKAVYILVDSSLRKLYNKKLFELNASNKRDTPENYNLMKKDEFDKDKNKCIHDRIFDLQDLYNLKPKNIEYENQFLNDNRKNSQQNV